MLFNLLQGVAKVAAKNDIRYFLNAVHIIKNEYDCITIESTDGIAGVRIKGTGWNDNKSGDVLDIEGNTDILLCRTSLLNVLKMFNVKTKLTLKIEDNKVTLNGVELTTVEGKFPDLGRVIDRTNPYADSDVGVNAIQLSKITNNLHLCMNKPKYPTLRIKVSGENNAIKWTGDVWLKDEKSLTLEALLMPVRLK